MKAAKVSELKASLSKYLARVKRGEQVVITERGRPVAKLVPMPPRATGISEAEWSRLLDLQRRGILEMPEDPIIPKEFWAMPRGEDPTGSVVRQLIEDRKRR